MEVNKNNDSLTILVNSCDTYHDVLSLFFAALKEYWPDCEFPIVINTESRRYTEYPASVHNHLGPSGADKWGERLRSALHSIDSQYVLMLYDDFILEAPVSILGLHSALDLLRNDSDIAAIYLTKTALPLANEGIGKNLSLVASRADYRLNSAPGIWRREDLINYTGPDDSPWAWEVFGSYRTYGDHKKIYSLNSSSSDIYPYNYTKGGAIYRGKWVKEVVVEKINKYNLSIDTGKRGVSEEGHYEPRSLKWKINFMRTGFKMVGLKSFIFIYRYVAAKLNG